MFGLFTPSSPLPTGEKAWIESRMRWLSDRLGRERMLDARVILPTDEFFPDPYSRDESSVRRCLDRVCRYMRVDPASLTLSVVAEEAMPGAAGLYEGGKRSRIPLKREPSKIYVSASQLENPESLIAILAHEVGHEILLGGELLNQQFEDHERITDLLTVFLGMGVFNANSTIQDANAHRGSFGGRPVRQLGYLTAKEFGYAFGLFVHIRGERKPHGARYLRPDAKAMLKTTLHYLRGTADSLFLPEATARPAGPKGVKEIMSGLRHRSPTFRLGALWDIWKTEECFPELVKEVERLLDDPDLHVRREATRTVALFGPLAAYLVPRLLEAVQAERDVWPQALESVARIGIDPKVILPEITRLLIRNPQASEDVARVLGLYPDLDLNEVIPALLTAFGREYSSEREMRELQRIVRSRVPDLEAVLRDHFAGDADLLRQLLWEVKQPHD